LKWHAKLASVVPQWHWQQRYGEQSVDRLLHDKTREPGKTPLSAKTIAKVLELTCFADLVTRKEKK
jgi:hypothetical protein